MAAHAKAVGVVLTMVAVMVVVVLALTNAVLLWKRAQPLIVSVGAPIFVPPMVWSVKLACPLEIVISQLLLVVSIGWIQKLAVLVDFVLEALVVLTVMVSHPALVDENALAVLPLVISIVLKLRIPWIPPLKDIQLVIPVLLTAVEVRIQLVIVM